MSDRFKHAALTSNEANTQLTSFALIVALLFFTLPISAQQAGPRKANQIAQPKESVSGVVLYKDKEPASMVKVRFRLRDRFEETTTDNQGRFSYRVPKNSLDRLLVLATANNGQLQSALTVYQFPPLTDHRNLVLTLMPARKVTLQVKNPDGTVSVKTPVGVATNSKPVVLGKTDDKGTASFLVPRQLDNVMGFAIAQSLGFDYQSLPTFNRGGVKAANDSNEPEFQIELKLAKSKSFDVEVKDASGFSVADIPVVLPGLTKKGDRPFQMSAIPELFQVKSDANGVARFNWIPVWQDWYAFYAISPVHTQYSVRIGRGSDRKSAEMTVFPKVPVRGQVVGVDGQPASGLVIRFHGSTSVPHTSRSMIDRAEAVTDAKGNFEVLLARSHFYLGFSADKHLKFSKPVELYIPGEGDVDEQALAVRPGTRVYGRVTVKGSGQAVPKQKIWLNQFALRDIARPGRGGLYRAKPAVAKMVETDDDGKYEFIVGAGKYWIQDSNQNKPKEFLVAEQKSQQLNFALARLEKTWLTGKIVDDETGLPIKNAHVQGRYTTSFSKRSIFTATTDKNGSFKVERESVSTIVLARSDDFKLAAITQLDPDDKQLEIRLKKTISATGKLLDEAGKPLANSHLIYGKDIYLEPRRSSFSISFGGLAKTNDKGEFELKNLVPGTKYQIRYVTRMENGIPMSYVKVAEANPRVDSKNLELGEVTYRKVVPYRRPTIAERITQSFNVKSSTKERLVAAEQRAQLTRQGVLVVLGDPSDSRIKQLFTWKHEDAEVKKLLHGFVWLALKYHAGSDQETIDFLNKLEGIQLDSMKRDPLLVFMDMHGKPIESLKLSELAAENEKEIDKSNLIRVLTEHTLKPLDGKKLLANALALAKKENKRVIVQETATWCGPCIMLSRFLDKTKDDWSQDYILVKMDHRWKEAPEIMRKMRASAPGGVPWYAILDSSGKILTTCNPNGTEDNIGYPSDQRGRQHFKQMILDSKIRLTEKQVDAWVKKINE